MLLNVLVALLFIACCLAPRMHPQDWWFTGFLGLFFPYLFVFIFLFFILWLFIRPSLSLFSLFVLIAGIVPFSVHYSFHLNTDFDVAKHESLRVMSWNVRHFVPFDEYFFNENKVENQRLVFDELKKYKPEVVCFQEFISIPSLGKSNPISYLKNELGYKYVQFSGEDIYNGGERTGIAIFSRLPILDKGEISFPVSTEGSAESTAFVDVKYQDDTLRIYSVHLQSFGFGNREYKVIDELNKDAGYDKSESIHLLKKMRNTFYWHGVQSDFISSEIKKSPHPVILAGDLNDVPNSYAYATLKGDMKDGFLEKGSGIGSTFTSATSSILRLLPTLRIDYIFSDKSFSPLQFIKGGEGISDHAFLISDYSFRHTNK
jgi:endonuclease/exonuclease/phosphatase family metal-dependent hydrolase